MQRQANFTTDMDLLVENKKTNRNLSYAKTIKKTKFMEMKLLPSSMYKDMWESFSSQDRKYIDK